jgi:hypothetical protein
MTPRDPVFTRPTLSTWIITGFFVAFWSMLLGPFFIMAIFAGQGQ